MKRTYEYDPSEIKKFSKDRMRFELGDTMVEGKESTCALCDEEYNALIPDNISTPKQWKQAKLVCLESIFRRFSYEVDTKAGPLSLGLSARAKIWQVEYEKLKAELSAASGDGSAIKKLYDARGDDTPPYFYNGMMSYAEAEGGNI